MEYYRGKVGDTRLIYYASQEIDFKDEERKESFSKYSKGCIQFVIDEDELYILHLDVDKNYRREGIGSKLFFFSIQEAKDEKVTKIMLDSMDDAPLERNLFYKHGMRFLDREKGPEMIGCIDKICFENEMDFQKFKV